MSKGFITYDVKPDCFLEDGKLCVTSPFGKRTDPVTGRENVTHAGVDCVREIEEGNCTATITAMASGTVSGCHWGETSNEGYSTARGNWVKVEHGNGITTLYQHLKNTRTVKTGEKVVKGQAIGYMGMTGKSTGAHLHIEVHINGAIVDPLPYLLKEKSIKEETEESNTMVYNVQITDKLYQGMRGEAVRKLQIRVAQISPEFEAEIKSHSMGANNEFDGSYGPAMAKTMRKVQKAAGLPETGIIDDATRELLNGSVLDLNKKILSAKKILEN